MERCESCIPIANNAKIGFASRTLPAADLNEISTSNFLQLSIFWLCLLYAETHTQHFTAARESKKKHQPDSIIVMSSVIMIIVSIYLAANNPRSFVLIHMSKKYIGVVILWITEWSCWINLRKSLGTNAYISSWLNG